MELRLGKDGGIFNVPSLPILTLPYDPANQEAIIVSDQWTKSMPVHDLLRKCTSTPRTPAMHTAPSNPGIT